MPRTCTVVMRLSGANTMLLCVRTTPVVIGLARGFRLEGRFD